LKGSGKMDISNHIIETECPSCHSKVSFTMDQAEKEETILCPGCKKEINLVDKNGSVKQAHIDVEKGIKDLEDEIKKLNKNLKINLKF
jgi:transcription initiation factor IIE alpha subunit